MVVAVLGIDLGKTIFSVAGLDEGGAVVSSRRIPALPTAGLSFCVTALRCCNGGVRRCPSHRPLLRRAWP